MLRLQFFGEFRAHWNDQTLRFRSDKVRALFAYLVLETGKTHSRRTLATLLWSNQSDTKANANLRLTLNRLRETLQLIQDHLLITRDTVAFTLPPGTWFDVSLFAEAFHHAFAHTHTQLSECATCIGQFQAALSDCHGLLLETLILNESPAFEDWLAPRRALWLERMATACNAIATHALIRRQFGEAEQAARRAVDLAPWREDGWRHLMVALHAQGQTAAALALKNAEDYPNTAVFKTLATQLQSGALLNQLGFAPSDALPAPLTSFVGRTNEVSQVVTLFRETGQRLVTLWGEGGVGKTRLALAVAAQLKNHFLDGQWFLALTTGMTRLAVLSALATLFGLAIDEKSDVLGRLQSYLRSRHSLVVIDNCEGIPSLAEVVAALLPNAPRLHILLTSRERLPLQAAANVRVLGLPYPDQDAGSLDYPAAQLFLERAKQAVPDQPLAPDLPAMLEICQRVGGLPLALELAATWTSRWSLADIAAYLRHAQLDLGAQWVDLPERHRDLRAVFAQSWQLLEEEEARWLRGLAPLQEPFTQAEMQALLSTHESPITAVTRLANLVNKALLLINAPGSYVWHPLGRQFALEQLQQHPAEAQPVWRAAASLYMQRGEAAAQRFATVEAWQHYARALDALTQLSESPSAQRQWLDLFFRQLMIGFALENAVEQKARLMQALEVAQRLNAVHNPLPADQAHLAHVWLWLGRVHYTLGEFGQARTFLERVLTQPYAEPLVSLQAASTLGVLYSIHGQYGRAVPLLLQALNALSQTDQPFEWVMAAGGLGSALVLHGDLPAAEMLLLQMQAFAEAQHYETGVAYAHVGLGMAAFWRNHLQQALAEFRNGSSLAIQAENWTVAVVAVVFEAWTLSRLGQHAAALTCLARHDELAKQHAAQSGVLWRMAVGAEASLNAGNISEALNQAQTTLSLAEQNENLFIAGLGHRLWALALPKNSEEVRTHLNASLDAFERGGAKLEVEQARHLAASN